MAFEHYIRSDGKNLRLGYTTGTCAALAAAGAVEGVLTGHIPKVLSLFTPKGIEVCVKPAFGEVYYNERSRMTNEEQPKEEVRVQKKQTSGGNPVREYRASKESRQEGMEPAQAACGVRKDAGDDADVTNGLLIMAKAEKWDLPGWKNKSTKVFPESRKGHRTDVLPESSKDDSTKGFSENKQGGESCRKSDMSGDGGRIRILGGVGIGRVTRPGLDQEVGEAAINSVPRAMIRREVLRVCEEQGYDGGITVTIYAPEGEKAAEKTLNSRLGIEGGISIIGTSGIVEPMSMKAYADSVRLQIRQTAPADSLILTPGNYGLSFLHQHGYDIMDIPVVVCSNYIGEALDEAAACGFDRIMLVGHIGKLVKLAAGIMNTHSSVADGRNEIFTAHAAAAGASAKTCRRLMDAVTTDACISILKEEGLDQKVLSSILKKAQSHLERRFGGPGCGIIMFSNVYGELGRTMQADAFLTR